MSQFFAQYLTVTGQRRKSMNRKHVLLVSNRNSSAELQRWSLTAHSFHLDVVDGDERAIECCHLQQFDIIVVYATDRLIDAKKLQAVLPILQDKMVLIQYDGENATKLTENIEAIFSAQKYRRILGMILPEPDEPKWDIPQFSLN
jgi:hypothetical protein